MDFGRRACARRLIPHPMVPVPFASRGCNRAARKQRRTTMTDTKTLTKAALIQFTGSEHWYRHALVSDALYTDGVQYVAETAGAYWLIDEIAFAQQGDKRLAAEEFQSWKLNVNADHAATLSCEDGNGGVVFTKAIEYTDFPLAEFTLYFMNNTILLPSEY